MSRFSNRNTPLCLPACLSVYAIALPASLGSIDTTAHLHRPLPHLVFAYFSSIFRLYAELQKCKAKMDKQNAKQKWRKETAISFVWLRFLTHSLPSLSFSLSLSTDHFLFSLYLFLFFFLFFKFFSAAVAAAAVSQLCFLFAVWCVFPFLPFLFLLSFFFHFLLFIHFAILFLHSSSYVAHTHTHTR